MIGRTSLPVVSPNSGRLPFGVSFDYGMSSDAPPEQATVTYMIEAANNVCFQVNGQAAKTFELTPDVTVADPGAEPFHDEVTLVLCAGAVIEDLVITQTIADGSGAPPVHATCRVQILSAQSVP